MKNSDLKVVAIILAIALFFTIVTSNAVSIASVVMLAKGGAPASNGTGTGTGTNSSAVGNNTPAAGTDTPVAGNNTPAAGNNTPAAGTDTPAATTPSGGSAGGSQGGSSGGSSSGSAGNNASSSTKSAKEVLEIYTKVLTNAKTVKPGFKKVEYQELPSDANSRVVSQGGTLVGTLLNLVDTLGIMTSKEKAEGSPEIHNKGDDTRWFPVYKCAKGCYLTDTSKIKSYKYETLSNGNAKITIVLIDEKNPEPMVEGASTSPSYTGAMFSPLAKSDIDATINGDTVKAVIKEVSYSLNYHDCTAILEYNPKSNQIVKLEQYMHCSIAGAGKVLGFKQITIDRQELINNMICTEFKY